MDGPAFITQDPIPMGGSYAYEFTADQAGTFFYHSHDHPDRQQGLGLYGAFIIDRENLRKMNRRLTWNTRSSCKNGYCVKGSPTGDAHGRRIAKLFHYQRTSLSSTDVIHMRVGQSIKLRFIGTSNNFIHPMHVHGGPFTVVARDGATLSPTARYEADTIIWDRDNATMWSGLPAVPENG